MPTRVTNLLVQVKALLGHKEAYHSVGATTLEVFSKKTLEVFWRHWRYFQKRHWRFPDIGGDDIGGL